MLISCPFGPENFHAWKTIVSFFWSSLVGRCKLLIFRECRCYKYCKSYVGFLANHSSSLFVSSTRSHPNKKRLRNSWLPSPKMVSCSSKIRRCLGWRPCTNLFWTNFRRFQHHVNYGSSGFSPSLTKIMGLGQPTAPKIPPPSNPPY